MVEKNFIKLPVWIKIIAELEHNDSARNIRLKTGSTRAQVYKILKSLLDIGFIDKQKDKTLERYNLTSKGKELQRGFIELNNMVKEHEKNTRR